jgi:RimJ/RimL family protein N-acetyltransferase
MEQILLDGEGQIRSERLALVPMSRAFLRASLAEAERNASDLLGMRVPDEWFENVELMRIRLAQLERDPTLLPWLLRAIVRREDRVMVGHIGFHTAPDPEYLRELAPGGVEIGYTIYPAYRRNGYASEAFAALMEWARREHGVQRFVLSISPLNDPSLRIAERFGFRKIGEQLDEIDGPEDIFLREVSADVTA